MSQWYYELRMKLKFLGVGGAIGDIDIAHDKAKCFHYDIAVNIVGQTMTQIFERSA